MPTSTAAQQPTKGWVGYCADPVNDQTVVVNYTVDRANSQPTPETNAATLVTAQTNLGGWDRFGKLGSRKG